MRKAAICVNLVRTHFSENCEHLLYMSNISKECLQNLHLNLYLRHNKYDKN